MGRVYQVLVVLLGCQDRSVVVVFRHATSVVVVTASITPVVKAVGKARCMGDVQENCLGEMFTGETSREVWISIQGYKSVYVLCGYLLC